MAEVVPPILAAEEVEKILSHTRGAYMPQREANALAASHEALRAELAAVTEDRDAKGFIRDMAEQALRTTEAKLVAAEAERDDALRYGDKFGAENLRLRETLTHFFAHATCPCGARHDAPDTHPHVIGCPVGIALEDSRG